MRALAATILCSLSCALSMAATDETLASPHHTFAIVQKNAGNWTSKLHFIKGHHSDISFGDEYPWPALFYVSPDDRWILQIQKSGSGENVALLYRVESNKRLLLVEPHLDNLAFTFLGVSKRNLYHTGIEFVAWDRKASTLRFTIRGSNIKKGGNDIERELKYRLKENVISTQ